MKQITKMGIKESYIWQLSGGATEIQRTAWSAQSLN